MALSTNPTGSPPHTTHTFQASTKFVFVPGPGDPGPADALPQPPLPSFFTSELVSVLGDNAVFASNPCRWVVEESSLRALGFPFRLYLPA